MDDEVRKKILREQLIKQSHGKHQVVTKYVPKYPDSAEREYLRTVDAYMKIERDILKESIPELKQIIREAEQNNRFDDKSDNKEARKRARRLSLVSVLQRIENLFEKIMKALERAFDMFGLRRAIQKIADLDEKLTIKEWKKTMKKTFGIDLFEDYYRGEFYREAVDVWISDNVDLIKTIPHDSLGKMKQLIYENYISGETSTNIIKEIQRQYGIDKKHAKLIARDQTAKLNAKITRQQQMDAGVKEYQWASVGDERVRDCHKELDGKIFSWNNPPEMWYYKRDRKTHAIIAKVYTGRKCHPGEDYQCRCRALAVFDLDVFDIPA